MSASTIVSAPSPFYFYAKNVAAAARAFLAALFAVKPTAKAVAGKELSLYRLYCLASRASSYGSVSPALIKELNQIASRG